MCCFSMPMRLVSDTNIFVRDAGARDQFLVYSMDYDAEQEGAMVLPLPVAANAAEDDVAFISLENYPGFFGAMRKGFPERRWDAAPTALGRGSGAVSAAPAVLKVHPVGKFEASFVPTMADFERLDPRFRLPRDVFDTVPQYRDYGFAVFKLRAERRAMTMHPMALKFPRRSPEKLFVPAVHIHDGAYHPTAKFDHDIYCQAGPDVRMLMFNASQSAASSFMDVGKSMGIVAADAPCFKKTMRGVYRNADIEIAGENGTRWMELAGDIEQIAYPGEIRELVDAIISELMLRSARAIEDCRQRHPRLSEPYFSDQSKFEKPAIADLRAQIEKPIQRATELFKRHAPKGLMNAMAIFEGGVESALRRALMPQNDWTQWM